MFSLYLPSKVTPTYFYQGLGFYPPTQCSTHHPMHPKTTCIERYLVPVMVNWNNVGTSQDITRHHMTVTWLSHVIIPQVVPRQTCRLFTHTFKFSHFRGGKEDLLSLAEGGDLFDVLLSNPVSICSFLFVAQSVCMPCFHELELRTCSSTHTCN